MIDNNQDPPGAWEQNVNLNGMQQREQRQRSIRFLMMFLLMLTLMDGEETQRRRGQDNFKTRKKKPASKVVIEGPVYAARRNQDKILEALLQDHPRYQGLITRNNLKDVDKEVRAWAYQQPDLRRDELATELNEAVDNHDPMESIRAFHFPWNATGFYRGDWKRSMAQSRNDTAIEDFESEKTATDLNSKTKKTPSKILDPAELEPQMISLLVERGDSVGVFLLPDGNQVHLPNSSLLTDTDSTEASRSRHPTMLRGATLSSDEDPAHKFQITLTKASGRAAFQLYSRSVPAIKELSIVDGFVKLYDSNTVGFSSRRDILLRVSGVLIHSLGLMSLVSSSSLARSALVIQGQPEHERHRRLENLLHDMEQDQRNVSDIRDDALALYRIGNKESLSEFEYDSVIASINAGEEDINLLDSLKLTTDQTEKKMKMKTTTKEPEAELKHAHDEPENATDVHVDFLSEIVFPYPYVKDDIDQSVGRTRTPAARSMPAREQLLEANAGGCEFELQLNVQEEEWSIGEWRSLLGRHAAESLRLGLAVKEIGAYKEISEESESSGRNAIESRTSTKAADSKKRIQYQALAMTLNGTIVSTNCAFSAELNATAIRTDWEHTTGKAINYSFYMMLMCLAQIVLLLRQLLHSQAQSAATRVSLLCIGWQTILDALLCLVHIYLSLAVQPLFTAFASVAFFKLLIFCVIEMKYMAIIIQARNANNGGGTLELLRRQIAMLHLRFYVALMGSFVALFYAWESYKILYILILYSFWVPQIVQNAVTESRRPLHHYYVYGMSLTRMFAPIYIFGVKNNFLKEVYPDSPTNILLCEMLALWVCTQAAILEAQGQYGARFMIPSQFLPPKFDYNRPIPISLLPPTNGGETPSEALKSERGTSTGAQSPLIPRDSSPNKSSGARNRMKGNRINRNEGAMTTETINATPTPPCPTFDCVICYNEIDIRNCTGYMLAPCDHLFHKDCLIQWMEVKMECPICRMELPAL